MSIITISPDMKTPLTVSALLHVLIVIVATLGIPFITPPPIDIPMHTIDIEFISPEDLAEEKAPEPKPAEPEKPKPAPKMTAESAPDLTKDAPPKVEEKPAEEQAETVPLPKKIAKPLPKKPKPPKKELTRKAPEPQESEAFQSLLKNLIPDAETQRPKPKKEVVKDVDTQLTAGEINELGKKIEDHLSQCWNLPSGARMAENLIIRLKLTMNPDRTVRNAIIVDQARYNSDSFYRAAADAAERATRNPRCSQLPLPEDKYEQWKTFHLNFNPASML